ncbi:DUF2911 domain-containing protein [Gaetbulibacter aestuarii]|uniref:DUF2911 domain-containing protein n=1 Tax=Gaetbulibacter aestuarii TaxID=1502358 RepID=A0ABW7MWR1_9FLAO
MKKTKLITTITMVFAMLTALNVQAQDFPKLDASPMDAAAFPSSYKESNKLIKIIYSRPQLKDRDINKLAPAGKVWRTGANEADQLTLYTDMKLGDTTIKAGTYTFYTIPGEDEWTAIVNTDLNTWGSYFYDESKDVARIKIPVTTSDDSVEALGIMFTASDNGVDMHIGWGKKRITVPFTKA